MLDCLGQIILPTTMAREPVYISTVISYSLAYDVADVMDHDNLATAWPAQIQISMVLIGTVKNLAIEPIVLDNRSPEKDQKTIHSTTLRGIRTMLHLLLLF